MSFAIELKQTTGQTVSDANNQTSLTFFRLKKRFETTSLVQNIKALFSAHSMTCRKVSGIVALGIVLGLGATVYLNPKFVKWSSALDSKKTVDIFLSRVIPGICSKEQNGLASVKIPKPEQTFSNSSGVQYGVPSSNLLPTKLSGYCREKDLNRENFVIDQFLNAVAKKAKNLFCSSPEVVSNLVKLDNKKTVDLFLSKVTPGIYSKEQNGLWSLKIPKPEEIFSNSSGLQPEVSSSNVLPAKFRSYFPEVVSNLVKFVDSYPTISGTIFGFGLCSFLVLRETNSFTFPRVFE